VKDRWINCVYPAGDCRYIKYKNYKLYINFKSRYKNRLFLFSLRITSKFKVIEKKIRNFEDNFELFKETIVYYNNFELFKEIIKRGKGMKSLSRQEEQILLVIYHLEDKAYLVNIRDTLKDITGKYYDVGTIYVPLKRLHKRGYLETSIGEPTAIRGGKAIKYYKLTEKGSEALGELKKVQDRLWKGIEFPLRLKL